MVTSATYRQAATITPEKLEKDPANRLLIPRPAVPHGCRSDPRLCARGQRIVVAEDRRAERAAVSAAGSLGSGGDARQRYAQLRARPWRKLVSPQHVHALEAGGAAGFDGHFQRPDARSLHRPPRADQHAAASPGDAERHAVRRGGPRARPKKRWSRAARRPTRGSIILPQRLLARPYGRRVENREVEPRRFVEALSQATRTTRKN